VSRFRQIVTGLSLWRSEFKPGSVHIGLVEKVAPEQVFLPDLQFPPVNIIPVLLGIYSCIIWGTDKKPVKSPVSQGLQEEKS
jgi:hypothetical protein